MRAEIIYSKNSVQGIAKSKKMFTFSSIMKAAIVISIFLFLPVLAGAVYTETTLKCISCHNDTGYPIDTDHDGIAAPYKRPHNNNTMCESCHGADPHKVAFVQPDGTYGGKSTAASCPECHQAGIPSGTNSNFTQAFRIPLTLRHSSDPSNGSVWGTYWNNADPKSACYFCHNKTLHDIIPLGRIFEWSPSYVINGTIGSNYSCSDCHYKGSANYNTMSSSFAAAGLQRPPEITNGSNWNGITLNYFNHSIQGYTDNDCAPCHGNSLSANARMSEFMHKVDFADMNNCISCHRANGAAPEVTATDLGGHTTLYGTADLTSDDCRACHYNFSHNGINPDNTYYCYDCHNKSAGGRAPIRSTKKFDDKKHGAITCINCHVADSKYHQGNPRGSVANSTYIDRFNTTNTVTTDCGDCHREANLDDAPFNAPGGGTHIGDSCLTGGGCHSGTTFIAAVHSTNPRDNPQKKPSISVPAFDYSTVTQGMDVNISVTVNFTNSPPNTQALVDGAQYRINNSDNTEIKQDWTPMTATDGNFNSIIEGASARINTNNLSGTYNIVVRGMGGGPSQNPLERYYPMNGNVSAVKSAILIVQPQGGVINGIITISGGGALEGALVTTSVASDVTKSDGTYSLIVPPGTYDVTASKLPRYETNTVTGVIVDTQGISHANMSLTLKPTGTISGIVTN